MMSKALGCLYGQAIGDALGARYQCKPAEWVTEKMENDNGCDGFLPILGVAHIQPGQVTDDTEMALSLVDSLINADGFDPVDLACSYVHWAQSEPEDIGTTTMAALQNYKIEVGNYWRSQLSADQKQRVYNTVKANIEYAVRSNVFNGPSLSNGCLMRISPLAIAVHSLPAERVETYCQLDTDLTHSDPIAIDAVFVYVSAICALLAEKTVEEVFELARNRSKTDTIKDLLEAARHKAFPIQLSDGTEIKGDREKQGYLGVALQGAFYELLHAESFSQGLERAIGRGGDTDTNGCITGALLGAHFGVDNIPEQWKSTVRDAKPRSNFPVADFSKPEWSVEKLLAIFKADKQHP